MSYFKYVSVPVSGESGLAGIKPNNYSSNLIQIVEMAAIAKADFPGLEDNDIHTVAYDGDRWKRQTGIEFRVANAANAPEDYTRVANLEYVFAGND